jgi:hypothetical protein
MKREGKIFVSEIKRNVYSKGLLPVWNRKRAITVPCEH